jgi:hypothetical protein
MVRDLQVRVPALEAGRRRRDPDADDRLLWALAHVVGDRVFSAAGLRAHARVDDVLGQAIGDRTVKAVGLRLRTLARGRHVSLLPSYGT